MSKRTFIALVIVFTGACAFLFNIFYKEAKNTAIAKLNEEQTIHAKQAARGIEEFFATWTRSLDSLSKMDEIIDTGAAGKHYMKLFYEANQEQIRSITRLDERGVIQYNFPQSSSVGADISDQKHVRELLRDHKPVIGDVFRAVEGFDAVALHVPVFMGAVFKGSIGILINFESIANRYLDVIKIGETGYAWVVSRDGTLIYSPVSGFTGKSVFEAIKDSPSLIDMSNNMLEGREGAAMYTSDGTGGGNAGQIREYAVYMPVNAGSTFWSIAVASAEQDVLSGLISFRDKLALAVGAIFICGMAFSILAAKAWFIVKEEEKRKQAEKKLQESEQIAEKFSTLFHAAPFAMALATAPGGVLYDVNRAWLDLAGFTRKDEVIGKSGAELGVIRESEQRERILDEFLQHGSVRNAEIAACTRAGVQLALVVNLDWVDIGGRKFILSSMQDITGRKETEEALSRSREWFRTTLGSIGDAVIATDVSGQVTFINPIGVELTGWKLEEALGLPIQSVFRIINEQTRRPAENIVDRVLREGCIVNLANHTALIAPDGREIPIEDSAAPIKDSAGNIIGVVLVFHDVTGKRRTQEVLKQSEEHYRSLFDNMLNGYAYCRMLFEEGEPRDFIYLNVNRAFETLTGLDNVIGKKVSEVIPGIRESDPELFEIYGRVAKTGVPERFETYVEALGMWFSISVYSPRKEHFVVVFDVITERKKADEALQQKEAALEEAQRIAHIGSWYWDAKTDVTTGTEELLRIYGFDPASQLMPDFLEQRGRCYPVEEWERVNAAVQTSLQTGIGYELDVQAIRDGESIWVTTRGEAVRDRDGQILGLRGTVQDITERKRAEEALRASERLHCAIGESIDYGVWVCAPDGRNTYASESFLKLVGITQEECSNFGWGDVLHPEDAERTIAAWKECVRTGGIWDIEHRFRGVDGQWHPVLARGVPVRDEAGEIVSWAGINLDISARKQAEEELRESEAKYRTLFENMTEEVHFWQLVRDEAGRIKTWRLVDANPPTIDSWGRTPLDEIKGKTADEIFGPGATDHYMPVVHKIMTERVPYSFEDYFPNLDKYFRFTSVPLMDYFITTGADITSIKKAEQALRQSRDELELRVHERTAELVSANEDLQKQATLLNLSHDAIFVVDSADVVSFWNSGAEDLYGFTGEQAIGNVASEFLQTRFPESLEQVANQVIEKGRWAGELRHTTTWGKELVVESRWALRPGEDGKPAGFLVVNHDITARKLAEEALRSNMARLELVNAELQEFAFIAAHDLQEPLRKIQTFCDIAMKRCAPVLDSSSRGYLDRVVSSAGRMRQLLNDLLEFSRVAARPGPLKKIDLGTIVREAADVFEASVKETGCQIEIENIPAIEADETQMLRLFQNLIGNALKFRGAGTPRIKVYGKLHRQGICELFVEDNGIGFDPKFAGLIFKPFQRLHGRSVYDGTGMGLAICRKIVERHGGNIRAESEPGKGSTFIIRLPVRQNQLGEYPYAGQQA